MLQTRKIIFLVLSVIVLAVVLWLVVWRPLIVPQREKDLDTILNELAQKGKPETANPNQESAVTTPQVEVKYSLKELSQEEKARQEIKNFVSYFMERFGTYSNQTDLSNLTELRDMSTASFAKFLAAYIDDIKTKYPYRQGYYGITTKVVVVDFEDFNPSDTRFRAVVETRRREVQGDEIREFNQKAEVEVMQDGDEYKINRVFWR